MTLFCQVTIYWNWLVIIELPQSLLKMLIPKFHSSATESEAKMFYDLQD